MTTDGGPSYPGKRGIDLTARTTLVAGGVLVAGLLLFALLIGGIRSQRAAAREADEAQQVLLGLERVRSLTLATQAGTRGYLITRAPGFLEPWRDARDRTRTATDRLLRLVGTQPLAREPARAIVARIESLIVDWQQPLIDLARRDPDAAVARFRTGEAYRRSAEITRLIAPFAASVQRLRARREREADAATRRATVGAIVGMGAFLAMLLAVGVYMIFWVGRPVARLAHAARALGEGTRAVRVAEGGRGEIRALARTFNGTAARLERARAAVRREADDARQARDELRAIVDASPLAIIARDRDGVITDFNAAAERLYDWPASTSSARSSPTSTTPSARNCSDVHDRALNGEIVKNAELRLHVIDGVRTLLVCVAPLRTVRGEVTGTVALAEDVSERESRAARPRARQARWRAAMRHLPGAALVIFDEQLRYRGARRRGAAHARARRRGTRGKSGRRAARRRRGPGAGGLHRSAPRWPASASRARSSSPGTRCERAPSRSTSATGDAPAWRCRSTSRTCGAPRRSCAASAAQLERSNRELEQFAYVASHDLQEPLRKIQAFGERLATALGPDLDPRAADYLERMRAAAARMSQLIADLLTFSRVSTHPHPFGAVDLAAVISDVIADLEPAIEETRAQIVTGRLPVLEGDAVQLRQLFQNLIANALKFRRLDTPPRVQIAEIDRDDSRVTLQVADNGIGFEEQYAERVFRMFERLHGRSAYEGSGIGLAVCRRIVERHGGTITAHGTPDRGARFLIALPLRQAGAPQERRLDGAVA